MDRAAQRVQPGDEGGRRNRSAVLRLRYADSRAGGKALPAADESERRDSDARRELAFKDGARGGAEDGARRPHLGGAAADSARAGGCATARWPKLISAAPVG